MENIDIKEWALQIRQIKIGELKEAIKRETTKYERNNSGIALANIQRLNEKLVVLQTK